MNEKDEFNQFFPDESLDKDKLSVEIPAEQNPLYPERIPSGYEPMGEIQLRGRVFKGLAEGRIPWWVLITGWLLFGGFALLMVYAVATSSSFMTWLTLAIAAIPVFILWKGTRAKLAFNRRRRNR
ncbi:hypothetical protein J5X98_07300 [Leptothermofonsia sichuanensis E412]|uniref:hypothetical protein n=1 Tax=Leptothermofonsia sichuanensis TaxID=2917832 RepID=UPI001CA79A1A|nr:hypothetical protein [Leptothermofonsia sichuanensis]QZZ22188.1 hypothetical protein J5X98_07300 [Leptothermofonsia sichuanensis E412]